MILSAVRVVLAALFTAFMAAIMTLTSLVIRSERAYYSMARFYSRTVLALCGVDLIVEGVERVDFNQNHVLVANHASMFDIPAVIAGLPGKVRIVYKKELERIPVFGWGLRYGGTYIAINRRNRQEAMHGLEEAAAKITRGGGSVLMFGEGTRTEDGKLQPFKRGPFNLAAKAGVPVVPLTINGSYKIMPKGSLRIEPGTITLVVERPIQPRGSNGKSSELAMRDDVHAAIERNYKNQ
jgi:1-acyl-sn-glycerol-3-phosphate acyltransferase